MPNWCFTTITFYSKNREQLKAMYEKVNVIFNAEATEKNDFGRGWLGDYVNTLLPEIGAHSNLRCRGEIDDICEYNECDEDYFDILTSTAWSPMLKMWVLIVNKHYSDVKIAYYAEEPSDCLFQKWDETNKHYPENFDVEINCEEKGWSYIHEAFISKTDLNLWLKEMQLDCIGETESMGAYEERFENSICKGMDGYISINKITVCPPSEE